MTLDNRTNIINNLWKDDDLPSQSSRKRKPDFDPKFLNKSLKLSGNGNNKNILSKVLKKMMPTSATTNLAKSKKPSLNGSLNKTLSKPLVPKTPKSKELKFSRSFKHPNLSVTLEGRRVSHRRDNSGTTPMTSIVSPIITSVFAKNHKFTGLIRPPTSKNQFMTYDR